MRIHNNARTLQDELHAAGADALERRIVELALERTRSRNGALFMWDPKRQGLAIDFHVVEGLVVNLPGAIVRPRGEGRPGGIALWAYQQGKSYLCRDAAEDPHYAPYFLDVASVVAVPIVYGRGAIGVLTVSARERDAFSAAHVAELEELAAAAAKFLRRVQLDRRGRAEEGRPFLIKGLSAEWLEVERKLERVAPTAAPVLVQGESGTGKELVAHALHWNSPRAEAPFVAVNCAAIPENLLESVLFGHVRGAFTGASFEKVGEFERAHGGTLFLDELGELPLGLQAKVLRAVEQGEIQPLGSNRAARRVDVRLVCATHRDLAAMVREGRFRDDLFYRVGVVTLDLPPLRSYKDNLEVLAHVFVEQAAQRHALQTPRLAPSFIAALEAYDFPGNIRELKNAAEHAVILAAPGEALDVQHLPRSFREPRRTPAPPPHAHAAAETLAELRERVLAAAESEYLATLLRDNGNNVRLAAHHAGIDPVTMYKLLHRRGLSRARARPFL